MKKSSVFIFYHSETSGAAKSILLLRNSKSKDLFFKTPENPFKLLWRLLRVLPFILKCKFIILNGLSVIKRGDMIIFSSFLRLLNKKIILYWHETNWHWRGLIPATGTLSSNIFQKIVLNFIRSSINIADSLYCANWLKNKFRIKNNVEVLYESINFTEITSLANKKSPSIFESKYVSIMAIGAVKPRKGIKEFLMVAKKTKNHYKFIWIGKKDELSEEIVEELDIINKGGTFEKVKIFEYKKNPYSYLKSCNLFFLPTLDEPFGIVFLEALSLGKFVICPKRKCGFSEIISSTNELGLIYSDINEVIDFLNTGKQEDLITNHSKKRIKLARRFNKLSFLRNLIKILAKYREKI